MIRKLSLSSCAVLVCFFLAGAFAAQAQDDEVEDLLQNGDFENFNQTPWTMWVEDASAMAMMIIDDEEVLTGDQSLLIDICQKGGGQRVELHQNPFNLKKGQQLTYAFWAKVEEGEIRPAKMIVNHRADPWTSYAFKEITITDEWTEFWVTANMTADDPMVGIYVELRDTEGLTWFDRFRFYEGEYIEEELEGMEGKAVKPFSKMSSTWASVKAGR